MSRRHEGQFDLSRSTVFLHSFTVPQQLQRRFAGIVLPQRLLSMAVLLCATRQEQIRAACGANGYPNTVQK